MRTGPLSFLTAVGLVVSGCAAPPDLAGADLPLAKTPADVEQFTWGLPFEVSFPAGFWSEGAHRYRFLVDCSAIETKVESNPVEFRVTRLTGTLSGTVYLRLAGLSDGIMMPSNMGAIHPEQPTTAIITFLGLDQATIEQASRTCEGLMEFDGDQTAVLIPGAPFRP